MEYQTDPSALPTNQWSEVYLVSLLYCSRGIPVLKHLVQSRSHISNTHQLCYSSRRIGDGGVLCQPDVQCCCRWEMHLESACCSVQTICVRPVLGCQRSAIWFVSRRAPAFGKGHNEDGVNAFGSNIGPYLNRPSH